MIRSLFFIALSLSFTLNAQNALWEIALSGRVLSVPIERKNKEIILICEDRRVYSLNSVTGNINWKIKPGGKLSNLLLSPDGSILVSDETTIFSIYGDGSIRWRIEYKEGLNHNITVNSKGDLIFVAEGNLLLVDRFGAVTILKEDFNGNNLCCLNNSLLCYSDGNNVYTMSYNAKPAWSFKAENTLNVIKAYKDKLYLVDNQGILNELDLQGNLINTRDIHNYNSVSASINYKGNLIVIGDTGTSLVTDEYVVKRDTKDVFCLFYSNGILINANPDWTINGIRISKGSEFYPSGKKQLFKRKISLSDKKVWGHEKLLNYYSTIVLDGNRTKQMDVLNNIEQNIHNIALLDNIPNFYDILLLSISKQNINPDIRLEAYKIIALSKDISFLPYLISNLEQENSYAELPYIFYAISQLSIDKTGGVIDLINDRLDDYYDEQIVINALYALYNINKYTNGEYVVKVFSGIEKILNGGYSRTIEQKCYDIIKKMK